MREKDCNKWLRELLKDGELHPCDEVRNHAKNEGYSMAKLKQARKQMEIKTFHQFDESGATENWFWYLEEKECGRAKLRIS